jgi:hypothetical protein
MLGSEARTLSLCIQLFELSFGSLLSAPNQCLTRYLAMYLFIHGTPILTEIRQDDIQDLIMARLLQPRSLEFFD